MLEGFGGIVLKHCVVENMAKIGVIPSEVPKLYKGYNPATGGCYVDTV